MRTDALNLRQAEGKVAVLNRIKANRGWPILRQLLLNQTMNDDKMKSANHGNGLLACFKYTNMKKLNQKESSI
jgi:hypothetical protein